MKHGLFSGCWVFFTAQVIDFTAIISFTSHVGVLMVTSGGPRVGKCRTFRLFILTTVTKKCPVQFHDRKLE